MTTPLGKLQKEALLLKLSSTEKAALHANLTKLIKKPADSTASAPRLTPSPFYFAPQFAMSFAAIMILLLGGGTAFAAQGSLPGDPLYAVKIKVTEPIQGALAVSDEDKIKFHTQAAQARIEEAEVLASQNRLDATTTAELESNLDVHLAEATTLAAKVADAQGPSDDADEANSSIAAHGEVLAALGSESSSDATRENSNVLAAKVRFVRNSNAGGAVTLAMAKTAAPMMAPQSGEPAAHPTMMTVSLSVPADDASSSDESASQGNMHVEAARFAPAATTTAQPRAQKNALTLEKRATSSLEKLTASVGVVRAKVSADVAAKLDARLAKISSLTAAGEDALAQNDFDGAAQNFSAALDRSVTLSTFLAANQRFDSGILGNLLHNDENAGDNGE